MSVLYSKCIETEAVFAKTRKNNESNVDSPQNTLLSTLVPASFPLVETPLKLFDLVWSRAELFFGMSSASSNFTLEMNF